MQSVLVFFMGMMVIIYSGVELVECLKIYETNPEIADREMQILCKLDPALDICTAYEIGKRKAMYMNTGRTSYPAILEPEPHLAEKRKSAYMRFGKRSTDSNDYVKRKSAYMRFGR